MSGLVNQTPQLQGKRLSHSGAEAGAPTPAPRLPPAPSGTPACASAPFVVGIRNLTRARVPCVGSRHRGETMILRFSWGVPLGHWGITVN